MLDGYAELLSQALEEQCEAYPLNDSQLGVCLACLKEPGSCMYNQPRAYRFEKDGVDPTALAAAAKAAMLNHALLFCAVAQRNGSGVILTRPVQTRKAAFQVEIVQAGEAEMEQKLAEFVRPFDLEHDILVRVQVYVTETGCWLAFDAHHLVCDGVSINILMSETAAAYAGKPLEAEPVSTACLGLFDRKLEEAGVYDRGREFFSEKLGGIEARTMLPPNVLISEDAKKKGNRSMTAELAGEVSAAGIKSFCKEVGIPSYRVGLFFVSAFSYAAAKFIGQEDTVVYIPSHGRNDRRLLKAVGMTVQTLPVVQHIDESRTVSEYVSGAVAGAAEAAERGTCPFVRLAPEFDLSADLFVNYQGEWSLRLGEQKAYAMPLTPPDALTPFMLWIFREGDRFRLMAFYEKSLYTPAYVRAFLDFYIHVLREFLNAAGTGRRLCELPLAPAGQLETLRGFNRTERPYDRSKTIIDMFREAAERFPDKTAVVYLDRAYTYRQVDDLSDRIAACIHSLGVGREDIVSVLIPRCEYMPIASLGVMKAGAAYQPLDPTYPPERLEFMIRDAGAKLLIADEGLRGLVAGYQGPVLFTGEIMDGDGTVLLPPCPDRGALLEWAPAPEDLYILLYTSGTTGQPKGAMLVHRNIANFCHWYHRYYALTERRKVAAYASYGFDANMMDTYPALTIGAELHIIDQDMRLNLAEMSRYFEDNGITDSFITTQVGRTFSVSFPHPTLLHLALSGETLTPLPPSGEYTLHNAYGPTECTIYSTACPILHDYNKVPIGFPLDNVKLYVIDKYGRLLPPGACGELCVSGLQVGRGYRNRPEQNAKAFTENPYASQAERADGYDRLYHTGDIARWLEDGNIDFAGRNDRQVKIRGFRIELNEVERIIRDFAGVKDATVAAYDDAGGGKFIAAYVVSDQRVDVDALNAFIARNKPPYMVPAVTMQIDKIPLNVNSKVDRRKLPPPVMTTRRSQGKAPKSETEKRICGVYAKTLGLEQVYADDSFFEIGGTSISATRLIIALQNEGFPVAYADVFSNPTPEALAKAVAGVGAESGFEDLGAADYGEIDRVLAENTLKSFKAGQRQELGTVLLTGATGFLGIHVLRELLRDPAVPAVWCLLRGKRGMTARQRLYGLYFYYFEEDVFAVYGDRLKVAEGDITDPASFERLLKRLAEEGGVDTVFNCAANVKHFSNGNDIELVNYNGVLNLLEFCKKAGSRLVHSSTMGIAGAVPAQGRAAPPEDPLNVASPEGGGQALHENELYIGQRETLKYTQAKFMAERAILEEVSRGFDGKIMRLGNLCARDRDGEFQVNFHSNAFMGRLKSARLIGKYPFDALDTTFEMSPIDAVAKAIVLLAATPRACVVFHPYNNHLRTLADLFVAMDREHLPVRPAEWEEYRAALSRAMEDKKTADVLSSMLAYQSGDHGTRLAPVSWDNEYTMQVLYRLGFVWPETSMEYMRKFIRALKKVGFFD